MALLMPVKQNFLEESKRYSNVLNINKPKASLIVNTDMERKHHHLFALMKVHLIPFGLVEINMSMLNYFLKVMALYKRIKMNILLKDGKEFLLFLLLITFPLFCLTNTGNLEMKIISLMLE